MGEMMEGPGINGHRRGGGRWGESRRGKGGKNIPTDHATLFQYGQNPVYMRLNLGTDTPETYRFMGSKGILDIGGDQVTFTPQSGKDESPSWYASSFPRALRDPYGKHCPHNTHPPPVPDPDP